jgi:hypothetical protein
MAKVESKELVGKCEVFREQGVWVFASYLIRVQFNKKVLLPDFAVMFLNTSAGRLQIDRISRQIIGMTNVNAKELQSLVIPLPDTTKQDELVAAMNAARAARRAKLVEADVLLAGLDRFLLDTLGLTPPRKDDRKVFAVRRADVQRQGRINSDYFHPERILALRAMDSAADHLDCRRLEEVVDFIRDQIKTPGPNYLSLAHVQSHTGELVEANEEVAGACSELGFDEPSDRKCT